MTVKSKNYEDFIRWMTLDKKSPCHKCLVRGSCTISFIDGSGCRDLAEFIVTSIEKETGNKIEETDL